MLEEAAFRGGFSFGDYHLKFTLWYCAFSCVRNGINLLCTMSLTPNIHAGKETF